MLIHGMSPSSLQSATLVPIPKDKLESLSVSDNYRAIALSSPLFIVLDTIILRKYGVLLSTCDLQNGFKEHGSTNACTCMVKETIQYYLQNGSNVYGTVLDATKAFDRIDFCKLFREMIKRKLPPLVIRLIMEMYEKQSMAVRWNNEYSDSFGVSNGVKQGGVLYPILFCIWMQHSMAVVPRPRMNPACSLVWLLTWFDVYWSALAFGSFWRLLLIIAGSGAGKIEGGP